MHHGVRAALCAAAVIAATLVPVGVVSAGATTQHTTHQLSAAQVRVMRADLRADTLRRDHGVAQLCAAQHLACQVQVLTSSAAPEAQPLSSSPPIGYGPNELEAAYGLAKHGGQRGTIAVIEAGAYPSLEADLAAYRQTFHLPACSSASGCFRQVDFRGGSPYPAPTRPIARWSDEQFGFETALDVDMASAACPKCKILEVQVPYANGFLGSTAQTHLSVLHFATAVTTARRLGATAVSTSYLYPADSYSDTGAIAAMMTQPGMAVVASSGDSGYQGGSGSWPQNLPTVVSVGGTSLYGQSGGRGYTEVAWNGSGSSCSIGIRPAAGQPAAISDNCAGSRAASDISAVADPATGVAVYDSFAPGSHRAAGFFVTGGTSASAPFIAGLFARAPRHPHELGPDVLYSHGSSAFNDVTSGSNTADTQCASNGITDAVCDAGPGWDGPTGLGTPNGLAAFK